MRNEKKTIAFIPARGGSKSIPLKNVKLLAGKPLVQWTIEAALSAQCVDEVFVATDSEQIKEVVEGFEFDGVSIVGRSKETATDSASTESALLEFSENHVFDYLFLIQATSPLLTPQDLDAAWSQFLKSQCKSLVSVVRQKRFVWESCNGMGRPVNYDPLNRPRRQDFDGMLIENGAFYLSSREDILSSGCRISGDVNLYEMCQESYIELDEPEDWEIVEVLLRRRVCMGATRQKSRDIKLLVSDCDGVLTDGGMYYSASGEELKLFNTVDGKGFERLREHDIDIAIITGESSEIVLRRAEKLNIDKVLLGVKDKAPILRQLAKEMGVDLRDVAYIGDDINDIPALELCGLSACPNTAQKPVKDKVDLVLDKPGGQGAVREFCEIILSGKQSNSEKHS